MKPQELLALQDTAALSAALDHMLLALSRSPLKLSAGKICEYVSLPPSDLTRMRRLHTSLKYAPLVRPAVLRRLIQYLFHQFPTLVVHCSADGEWSAHLYKYHSGKKSRLTSKRLLKVDLNAKRPPRPGTTRWFLNAQEY